MSKKLISYDDEKPGLGLPDIVEEKLYNTFSRVDVSPTGTLEGDTTAVISASLEAKNEDRLEVLMAPGHYLLDGVDVAAVHGRYLVGDGVTFSPGSFVYPFKIGELAATSRNSSRSTGQGRIAIEIDDGLANHWTHIFPATKKLGITLGTGWHTRNGAQWISEAHRHGWEIIAHMPYDLDWRTVPLSEVEAGAVECLDAIEAAIGTREGIGFIYPRHNRNLETDRVLSKYFTRGRGDNNPVIYTRGEGHPWMTASYFLDPAFNSGGVSTQIKNILKAVAAQDGDMVFYMHSGSPTHALTQIEGLTEFVNYARSLGIQFVNPGQIWGSKNLIADPYLDDTNQWSLNGRFSWDTSVKYHGTRSAKFTPGADGNYSGNIVLANPYFPSMGVPSGMFGIYRVSARIKTDGVTVPAPNNGIRFNGTSRYNRMDGQTPVQELGGGATPWLIPESDNTIPAMDWERIQAYTYIGPATTTFQLSVGVQNIAGGSNPIWIDEIKMELVGFTTEVTFRGTLTGNTLSTTIRTSIHDAYRHNYVVTPDTPLQGVLSVTTSDGQGIRVNSSEPSDTNSFTVTITPGGKYVDNTLTSEGA